MRQSVAIVTLWTLTVAHQPARGLEPENGASRSARIGTGADVARPPAKIAQAPSVFRARALSRRTVATSAARWQALTNAYPQLAEEIAVPVPPGAKPWFQKDPRSGKREHVGWKLWSGGCLHHLVTDGQLYDAETPTGRNRTIVARSRAEALDGARAALGTDDVWVDPVGGLARWRRTYVVHPAGKRVPRRDAIDADAVWSHERAHAEEDAGEWGARKAEHNTRRRHLAKVGVELGPPDARQLLREVLAADAYNQAEVLDAITEAIISDPGQAHRILGKFLPWSLKTGDRGGWTWRNTALLEIPWESAAYRAGLKLEDTGLHAPLLMAAAHHSFQHRLENKQGGPLDFTDPNGLPAQMLGPWKQRLLDSASSARPMSEIAEAADEFTHNLLFHLGLSAYMFQHTGDAPRLERDLEEIGAARGLIREIHGASSPEVAARELHLASSIWRGVSGAGQPVGVIELARSLAMSMVSNAAGIYHDELEARQAASTRFRQLWWRISGQHRKDSEMAGDLVRALEPLISNGFKHLELDVAASLKGIAATAVKRHPEIEYHPAWQRIAALPLEPPEPDTMLERSVSELAGTVLRSMGLRMIPPRGEGFDHGPLF